MDIEDLSKKKKKRQEEKLAESDSDAASEPTLTQRQVKAGRLVTNYTSLNE